MDSKETLEQIKHCGNRDWRLAIEDIEKKLEVLEILKNRSYIIWVENDILYSGRCDDIEIPLDKEDFESEEDYKLIKEYLDNDK